MSGSGRVMMGDSIFISTAAAENSLPYVSQTRIATSLSGSSGTVYGFTGEEYDAATGLVYLRARYYNPYLNQFQSRDPFPGDTTLPASQNGYSYVHNNPVNYTDPSGLCAEVGDEACWALAEHLWLNGHGSLRELGVMDYRDLDLLRTYASCASDSVFTGTHPVVKARAYGMISELARQGHLISDNPADVVSQGYRTPEAAHRFSTSYHLFYGFID